MLNNTGSTSPSTKIDVAVVGNVAFDILCFPVNEVPRHHSLTFEKAAIAPGGCGSNAAIGLAAQGLSTALVACIGADIPGDLALSFWRRFNVNTDHVCRLEHEATGVSVGLVDTDAQPRFVHTSGSNQHLTIKHIPLAAYLQMPIKAFHLAGYFNDRYAETAARGYIKSAPGSRCTDNHGCPANCQAVSA